MVNIKTVPQKYSEFLLDDAVMKYENGYNYSLDGAKM